MTGTNFSPLLVTLGLLSGLAMFTMLVEFVWCTCTKSGYDRHTTHSITSLWRCTPVLASGYPTPVMDGVPLSFAGRRGYPSPLLAGGYLVLSWSGGTPVLAGSTLVLSWPGVYPCPAIPLSQDWGTPHPRLGSPLERTWDQRLGYPPGKYMGTRGWGTPC